MSVSRSPVRPEERAALELRGFGFAFGERTVIRAIDLEMPSPGVLTILGPVAAGKSSLMRLLSGEIAAGACQSWGTALYRGAPLGEQGWPALAGQRARQLVGSVLETIAGGLAGRERLTQAEQRDRIEALLRELGVASLVGRLGAPVIDLPSHELRCVALVRAVATGADIVCADEPTAGLPDAPRATMLALLERVASMRGLLLVTHNAGDVRALGGDVALLAGGVLQEKGPAADFLRAPQSPAGEQFVRTGSCAVPSPDAVAEEMDPFVAHPETPPPELVAAASYEVLAPQRRPMSGAMTAAIRWVIPERLAGIPRPGLLHALDDDLGALAAENLRWLVCLEEVPPIAVADLQAHGMELKWQPIPDMRAPTLEEAQSLCGWIEERLAEGERIAVHCRGGLGRTGTVLAAFFVRRGASTPEALSAVRRVEPRFVQSTEQLDFLRRFSAEQKTQHDNQGIRNVIG